MKEIANQLRRRIIETGANSKIPHIGSCLSCLDLLVYIYWNELEIDPLKPNDIKRDRFLLSKGHGAPALFQVLAERGFLKKKDYLSLVSQEVFFMNIHLNLDLSQVLKLLLAHLDMVFLWLLEWLWLRRLLKKCLDVM